MTTQELKKMVWECLRDDSDRLSEWEIRFLDDNAASPEFSQRQAATIEQIWQKLFGGST